MRAIRIWSFCALVACITSSVWAESVCPRGIEPINYRLVDGSHIGVEVRINNHGPFVFMLDTGSQITIVDSGLAVELDLMPEGTIGVVSVIKYARTDLASVDSFVLGSSGTNNFQVAIQSLASLQQVAPGIRGILGVDFLRRFDLLIDNGRKLVCLDDSHKMQSAILGERVAVVRSENAADGPFSPILIPVHLAGDRQRQTILRIDSGTSTPILFSNRAEILPWLQKAHASRGIVSGAQNPLLLASVPEQDVRISGHFDRRISFLTPINDGSPMKNSLEDGLLPTALFKEILISFRDGFVVFNPRDACPPLEAN